MLKQRVITASTLAIAFLGLLFYSPWFVFSGAMTLVILLAAWEWSNLSGVTSIAQRILYVVAMAGLFLGVALTALFPTNVALIEQLLLAACAWWAVALLWIQSFPSSAIIWGAKITRLVMGVFVLLPAWLSIVFLRSEHSGSLLVLLVVLLVAAADIGAYFSGRALGKRKLAPDVSPGKSWEGVIGGAILALVVAISFNYFASGYSTDGSSSSKTDGLLALLIIAVPTAFISVVGDLLESMVKRHRGVKDSSQLLPGHGGVLDRVDGLLAAIPVFLLALLYTDWQL